MPLLDHPVLGELPPERIFADAERFRRHLAVSAEALERR